MYFFYYFPVGTDARTRRFPVITIFLAVLCTAVFVVEKYFYASVPLDFRRLIYYSGVSPWPAALGAALLHFGLFHLLGNLLYLLTFGWYLEERLGTVGYVLLLGGSALAGNLSQGAYNVSVLGLPGIGIVGASGIVSGVLGAFVVRLYSSRVRVAYWVFMPLQAYTRGGRIDVPVVFALALWVLMQLTRALVQLGGAGGNVAYITHIAGFVFGAAFVLATGGWRDARLEAIRIRARRYLRQGQFHGAAEQMARYAEKRPGDGRVRVELARTLAQTGDARGALREYRRSCENFLSAGDRSGAENAYEEAARAYPGFTLGAEEQINVAFGLERNLKDASAADAYERFYRRFPGHAESSLAMLRSANLRRSALGDVEGARERYRTMIDRYPDDAWVDFAREQARILG